MRGRNSRSAISDTGFLHQTEKSSMYLPCNEQEKKKKKVLTVQLASAITFIWHMGAPRPSASVMKESVSHNGAMTRAESPPGWGGADACW